MVTIEKVRLNLEISNIKKVSEKTGININALYRIKNGDTKDPAYSTIATLAKFYRLGGSNDDKS